LGSPVGDGRRLLGARRAASIFIDLYRESLGNVTSVALKVNRYLMPRKLRK
jgi:hypothetical protein